MEKKNIENIVNRWEAELKNNFHDDKYLELELESVKHNPDELYERFYKDLEFGTAGMRGIMGVGPNRLNIYTVRWATQGLAHYLKKKFGSSNLAVAISYDSRINSENFAKEAACVLAGNGIKSYITAELKPTPTLSFLVRKYKCNAGIMITASHNSAEYNGYKCYGSDGGQMTDKSASLVADEMKSIDMFKDIKLCVFEEGKKNGLIDIDIKQEYYDEHVDQAINQCINKNVFKTTKLKVVYSPLNGTGLKPMKKLFEKLGVDDVSVVPEQEYPDGNFPTCKYPNPEMKEALDLSLKLANEKNPDLVLATDPDCDRVGIAVRTSEGYSLMSGNVIGTLLTHYILSQRTLKKTLPPNPMIIRTIVSTPLVDLIAKKFDCRVVKVLTGFKYIGEQILNLEKSGKENNFIFGFEESSGFLAGSYVRDKDAIVASALICEMVCYYKEKGKTLVDAIEEIYNEFGFYKNLTVGFTFKGSDGESKMKHIMDNLRQNVPYSFANLKVINVIDYLLQNVDESLPKSNVISYELENGNSIIIRPSGTEPKIKIYITAVSNSSKQAEILSQEIIEDVKEKLQL